MGGPPEQGPTLINVSPLSGNIGAEILDVDLGEPTSNEIVGHIRQAVLRHKVVFLRNQHVSYPSQVAFARKLGELMPGHPIFTSPFDQPYLREFDSRQGARANHWHTDLTFLHRPPAFALLHAVIIPEVGGDTIWANTATAYASLPEELRGMAHRLRVVHSNDSDYTDATVAHRSDYIAAPFETEHPAVQVHPETGERAILLGGFARRVSGLTPHASREVIEVLQEYATRPEHTVRWRWRASDLAIWDNRATQHYAIFDYAGHRRCERVAVAGSVPVGTDGRQSTLYRDGDDQRGVGLS